MVSPVTVGGGYENTLLAAQIANMYAGNQYNLANLAGYYDPYMLGWASSPGQISPTLERDSLSAQVSQWGVQNGLEQGRLDLSARQLDAQIAQWAKQGALDEGTLTGFYNGLPTLAREQLAATIGIANADNFRQWAQLRGSQLLQQQVCSLPSSASNPDSDALVLPPHVCCADVQTDVAYDL